MIREIVNLLKRKNLEEVRCQIAEENREMERVIVKAEEVHIQQLHSLAEEQTDPDERARFMTEAQNREQLVTKAQEILRGVGA